MTILERYYEDHPERRVEDQGEALRLQSFWKFCPHQLGYESQEQSAYVCDRMRSCEECWNRQIPKAYDWIAHYTVRSINGQKEDRELTDIRAADIRTALASAQIKVGRMPKEDPEIEAAFIRSITIADDDFDF